VLNIVCLYFIAKHEKNGVSKCSNHSRPHHCNWEEVKCLYCPTGVDNKKGNPIENKGFSVVGNAEMNRFRIAVEYQKMFTHHVCLSCGSGLHGGVCNRYGITFH
jgi:hypothetical protein